MSLNSLRLYIHTIQHLKFEQIVYRIWHAARSQSHKTFRPKSGSNPQNLEWVLLKARVPFPLYPWFYPSEIATGQFRLLNDSTENNQKVDWTAQGKDKLWRYNLHYFNYLHPERGLEKPAASVLMNDWIQNNPPGTNDAWAPFPISLRIVNWIKYLHQTNHSEAEVRAVLRSLYDQALWLERILERHLLGNHFFKNLKAMIFAGLFFKGCDGERWLKKGARFLAREIDEQILPDGGHFERSPMYHSMILEDCLDLLNIIHDRIEPESKELEHLLLAVCPAMAKFLGGMLHPDQQIALFNDSAFGIELPATRLLKYTSSLINGEIMSPKDRYWSFPHSGYFIMAPEEGDRIIIDCGPVGPDYQPGHAHCDTLSYELSLDGQRIIVDSGVHDYEKGPMRQYVRGTRAHNTVMVDGADQSEMWGAFRVARRARPIYARIEQIGAQKIVFSGAHDGYKRLAGKVIHERFIDYESSEGWKVEDRVKGRGKHRADSFIHINPDFRASIQGSEVVLVNRKSGSKVARIIATGHDSLSIEKGWYCPEFGLKYENDVIVLSKYKELPLEMRYRILKA